MNNPITEAATTARSLLLSCALAFMFMLAPASAQTLTGGTAAPGATVAPDGTVRDGGMPASTGSMSGPCAGALDQLACYKRIASGKEPAPALPNREGDARLAPDTASPTGQAAPPKRAVAPEEYSDFQLFVFDSAGKMLPIYGHSLFIDAPSTFSPLDNIPVTPDYLIGPGDELVVRGWGQVDFDLSLTVDRNGAIYLPKVGNVNVAGIRYQALHGYLKNAIGRVFHNFELNVSLGKLRSIQVFVVGQARRPGAYTVSSLSTLINTLFASGGPSVKGSLRHIQIKRNGSVASELDMYDFLLKGDKSGDIALLPGDVIYIPPVGQLSAISGSVNNPAIYELKQGATSLAELIELAGGLTTTAGGGKVRVERIDGRRMRKVEEFSLNRAEEKRLLQDGDVVQVEAISGQFDNAVTLRGHVANPGRYPWREGMRVKDMIPGMEALIVPEYWAAQNRIAGVSTDSGNRLRTEIKRNEHEINWDYALIERMNLNDLNTSLLPFSLGKALSGNNAEDNPVLQPGDVVTIFSNKDIQAPVSSRSIYVRLEGEFNRAGVYKVQPGETLRQLVERMGGLTPNAYLYAAEFNRESVRVSQQNKLDEMIDRMADDIERNLATKSQAALSKEDVEAAKASAAGQRALLERMRLARASGRIVFGKSMDRLKSQAIPDIVLEDGDRFLVPPQVSTVSVMGMVYNQNAFMYQPDSQASDYLDLSGGPTRDADESRIYVLRADGSVLSSQNRGSLFGGLGGQTLMPGDTLVVPESLDKFSLTRELKDWSQIFYQFALGVSAINVLRL